MSIKIKKKIVFNIFAFVLMFFLIFDLKLIGSIGSALITLIFCFIALIVGFKRYNGNIVDVVKKYKNFLFFYLCMILYVFLRFLFSSMDDYSYVLTTLKTTLVLLSTLAYLMVFNDSNLKNIFFNIFFLNGLICLFLGTFPDFKFLIYPFKYGDDPSLSLIGASEYRDAVLAGSSYFGVASLFGLAFAFCLKISLQSGKIVDYVKLIVIAFAGLLLGRVALLCYLLSIIYFFVIKKSVKVLFLSVATLAIFFIMLNSLPVMENAKIWLFEMFLGDGISNSESVDQFKNMIYLPDDQFSLLFGDARYGSSDSYYGGTDSGYIRNILFGGLFFLLILLMSFFSIFFKNINNSFVWLIIILCMLLHFKGIFIFNNPGFFGVVLIVYYIIFKNNRGYL
ncbi:hypothetical protein [Acinetobacter johnsonii]|uniref:hypothetical protein n=1 Tax=Acinetobacter johnsonii TaxID=40214 RepID=UPI00073DA03E|nr:hypothetical protein [Acinetobacter johnsonii]ALV74310.1 hypothetical protein RZ95_16575 [Acinetobacter johnsonii XBB1]